MSTEIEQVTKLQRLRIDVATEIIGLNIVHELWPCYNMWGRGWEPAKYVDKVTWRAGSPSGFHPVYIDKYSVWPPRDVAFNNSQLEATVIMVPFYESDFNAMMVVVGVMNELGYRCWWTQDKKDMRWNVSWMSNDGIRPDNLFQRIKPSLCEAVCESALALHRWDRRQRQ